MEKIRLQKHIADLGICSRRKAEELIRTGKVKLNGKLVTEMGLKVDPEKDTVEVLPLKKGELEGVPTSPSPSFSRRGDYVYIALHKPIDYITSASSEQGESVMDLLTTKNCLKKGNKLETRVFPVGRLDKDSEGLVLLTNDGELTNQLTHPRYEHEKEYEVTIDKPLGKDAKKILQSGMRIEDGFVKGIKIIKESNRGKRTVVTVILKEGKNRQIRKMFGGLGYHVVSLKRTRMSNLKLGTLPAGKWKFVKKEQIV